MKIKSLFLLSALLVILPFSEVKAREYRPVLSGNLESGERYIPLDDYIFSADTEEEDAYKFNMGYLQLTQKFNPQSYLSLRYQFNAKNYELSPEKDNIAYDLINTFKFQLRGPLTMKLILKVRDKNYENDNFRDNDIFSPALEFRFRPRRRTAFVLRYTYKDHHYRNDSSRDSRLNSLLGSWQRELSPALLLKAKYKGKFRDYKEETKTRKDSVRQSVSLGFEYKF